MPVVLNSLIMLARLLALGALFVSASVADAQNGGTSPPAGTSRAVKSTDFTQSWPKAGEAPSQKTELRVLYADDRLTC